MAPPQWTGLTIRHAIFVSLLAYLTTAAVGLTISKPNKQELPDKPSYNSNGCKNPKPNFWYDDACCNRQCEKGWTALPTVLVSLDGFRADYFLHNRTSTLARLVECGSHTPYMFPCYPTKTFPNHYAIVTGLYPESSGIVDNNMYDSTIEPPSDRKFSMGSASSYNPQWWKGEPIWNTAVLNGLKSAVYFWPGSDVAIENMTATYWYKYDGSVPFVNRVDQVINWLLLDEKDRPSIINVYFDEPDETGHNHGPQSDQMNNQLIVVDAFMNYLMTKLYENGLFHCVNKIILADHGMSAVNNSDYVLLSNYIPSSEQTATNMRIFEGPVMRIQLDESNYTADEAIDATRCKNDQFRVYKRLDTPKRLHYSVSPRIGDVILDGDEGVEIYRTKHYTKYGDHGFDYKDISMHALFVAHGPAFKQNYTMESFQNVELYNLLADLLALEKRPPTNSTEGSLYALLRNPPETPSRSYLVKPQRCPTTGKTQTCGDCSILQQQSISDCTQPAILAKALPEWSDNLCSFDQQSVIYRNATQEPVAVQSVISSTTRLTTWTPDGCSILDPLKLPNAIAQCADVDAISKMLASRGASMYPLQPFDSEKNTCAADWYEKAILFDGLFTGPLSYLQQLTLDYAKQYDDLTVISGVIYDYDGNGHADPFDVIQRLALNATDGDTVVYFPSHVYQILVRCPGAQWAEDRTCSGNAGVMSFILPNRRDVDNCQSMKDYLYMHTARVRDIELLTGLEFFPNWSFETAVRLRLHVNQDLWES